MTIGRVLEALRKERRMTLEKLALDAGTNGGYLSRVERGKAYPSLPMLIKLAEALGTTPSAILATAEGVNPTALASIAQYGKKDETVSKEVQQALRTLRELSPENQRLALEFLRMLARLQAKSAKNQ